MSKTMFQMWAYGLRDLGLLEITPTESIQGRNGPNEFDFKPFIAMLEEADTAWQKQQARRKSLELTP